MKNLITVILTLAFIDYELLFNVAQDDINKYIDQLDPKKKVQAAYNFLSRTVAPESRAVFDTVMLDREGKPRGTVVLTVFGEVFQQFDGDVQVTVKKPNDTQTG